MPNRKLTVASVLLLLMPFAAVAQGTPTGTLYGYILDPDHRPVPGTRIVIESSDRSETRDVLSNRDGLYSLPALQPGPYHVTVEKTGFKTVHLNGVVIEADQQPRLDFVLTVGSASETITVEGGTPLLNTTDGTVSTFIGNQFVENMPLNGRSFSSLLNITPGVTLTQTNTYEQGQFSVNGQRPDANYFLVDGVSANLGSGSANFGQGGSGQLPATSAFGGTSNLVSLDALQEFRVQTSTFAPEYGRTPGAQVSVVTKSGTNDFHGTAFEYFRNDVLDANDWFANHAGLPKPALRQNDFGGVFGGPILKRQAFFFGSYEGLRVRQPQIANTYVPTVATRKDAPAAVQPLLDAFPLPTPGGKDFGDGTAAFIKGYSDPSSLDASSLRIDYAPLQKVTVFGRYVYAPSSVDQRAAGHFQSTYSNILDTKNRLQGLTLGSNQTITTRLTNELRFNFSRSLGNSFITLDNFGGAVVPSDPVLFPSFASSKTGFFSFYADFNPYGLTFSEGRIAENVQHQFNITDNVSKVVSSHQLKFGLDYRRLRPEQNALAYQLEYLFESLANVLANSVPLAYAASRTANVQLVFSNWSLFAQDTWNPTRNFTITYGVRWECNSAPSSPNGTLPFTIIGVNNPATMTLAPPGTRLWSPQKDDFAPRLAIAWNPHPNLVFRAGAGMFYDLGYSYVVSGMIAFPFVQANYVFGTSFPLSATEAAPPPFTTSPPSPYSAVVDPNHYLPRTYEWNAAIEQSLGKADAFSITYLGAGGRKLMRQDLYNAPNPEFTGEVDVMRNGASSSYQSLQSQYRHRLAHGLNALASYTWSHSIDDVSSDVFYVNTPPGASPVSDRGSSDYDIRNTFSGAISYDIPGPEGDWGKRILGGWSTDSIVYARSASPVNVVTGQDPFQTGFLSDAYGIQRPNVVPTQPFYLRPSGAPGGKVINAAAFATPATGQGNLGRNALRGFGATQWDMTLRRKFRLTERISLQMRSDFFNIFNHPNFGSPINYLTSPQFGYSTQTLNSWLGSGGQGGGLNPLYQIGGPRSIQLAAKLQF